MPRPAPAGLPLTLFNSLTRTTETFRPIDPDLVRVYSCGPTVYARQHLGNMRAYIFADTLTRTLRWAGYPVKHVINITDVGHLTSDADTGDDKMERAAAAEQLTAWDIADRYTRLFKQDLARLNVAEPALWSVATAHIPDMIAFGERIAGSTYETPSGLYFDTRSVPDYGRLAGHRPDEGREVSRIDDVEGKRHPSDFAIWRKSEQPGLRQMEWESPWGVGAPGWHLECSVMSMKHLGERFDIHTGGIDHREIHHPNEIAQNQAYTGSDHTGATIWMHNNFLVERGAKMSKSSGGFATLDTLADAGVHPLAYRLLCLSAHYRSELEFSADNVMAALTRLKRLVRTVNKYALHVSSIFDTLAEADDAAQLNLVRDKLEQDLSTAAEGYIAEFAMAMSDDLNTPMALTVVDRLLVDPKLSVVEKARLLGSVDLVLGLDIKSLKPLAPTSLRVRPAAAILTEADINARLAERREARAAKDFARSDAIRDALIAEGVEVMDGDPLGWEWRVAL